MQPTAQAGAKRTTLEATVIRADGTVEELGVIATYDRRRHRRIIDRLLRRGQIRRA